MTKGHPTVHQIELRIAELSARFNSMDPTPFQHRDLDRDGEEFLEGRATVLRKQHHHRAPHHRALTPLQ
jgi:hypothetical protein